VTWIHDLPHWLFAILTLSTFVGAALGGLVLARRWGRQRGLHALVDNGVTGWIFSAILTVYAIAIGLIAVAAWSDASQASSVASYEAAAIAALYRDLTGYPDATRGDLQGTLARYTRFVVDEAWPAQRRGDVPTGGRDILDELQHTLFGFDPANDRERLLHGETLRAFNIMIDFRRQRLEAVSYAVPGRLWSVVLVGAAIAISASWVFSVESLRLHALLTGLLAAMIGLLVFFIASVDRPYRGRTGADPGAYELVLHQLIEHHPGR
jgi:hypothetical protein